MIDIIIPLIIFAGTVYAFADRTARTRDRAAMIAMSAVAAIYFVHALRG